MQEQNTRAEASTIASSLTNEARSLLLQTPQVRGFELIYEIAKMPDDRQAEMIRRAAEGGLSREELRTAAADAKKQAASQGNPSRGRPSQSRAFRKLITLEGGVRVIVHFRKTKATDEEVIAALKEALRSFAM